MDRPSSPRIPENIPTEQAQPQFLTKEEELMLESSVSPQERRRIQNRVAQRVYRQKQKQRLRDLEERLVGSHVAAAQLGLPEVDIGALRASARDLNTSDTWSSLATSYPIAATLNRNMSRGPISRASISGPTPSKAVIETAHGSPHSVGYILPTTVAAEPRLITMPFLPVRIAVQKNLGILGVCLELYRAGVSDSPFRKIQFGGSIAAKEAISKIAARAPDLIPTVLQFEVDHQPYIDIIPCHEIRDKILEMVSGGGLDQGELCRDIESGLSVWGRTAWDRRSWEWSSEFVKKWVWLFENEETLAATNFWRAQRGEAAIVCGGDVE